MGMTIKNMTAVLALLALSACGLAPSSENYDTTVGTHPPSVTCVYTVQCDATVQDCVTYTQLTKTQCDIVIVEVGQTPIFPPLN